MLGSTKTNISRTCSIHQPSDLWSQIPKFFQWLDPPHSQRRRQDRPMDALTSTLNSRCSSSDRLTRWIPVGVVTQKKSATNNWCFASLGVIIHYFHSKNEGPPLKNTSSWILLDLALVFPITAEMKRNTGPTSWNPGLENLWRFIDVQWHCQQRQHENPWCVEALMSNVVVCSAMAAMASQNHPKNHRKSKQVRSFWIFHQCN